MIRISIKRTDIEQVGLDEFISDDDVFLILDGIITIQLTAEGLSNEI